MTASWKTFATIGGAGGVLLLLGANGDGCGGSSVEPTGSTTTTSSPGTSVRLDFAARDDFYAAPFPSEHRRTEDGHIDVASFPNPEAIGLVQQIADVVAADADGFGTTSAVFFSLTDPIDPASLPDLRGSLQPEASVFLVSVDPDAPDADVRYPVKVGFFEDGGPFGAPNMLVLLPYQGVPLRPGTLYAAVVQRSVLDAGGAKLDEGRAIAELAEGGTPDGMSAPTTALYRGALTRLQTQGIAAQDIAGLSVFRTGNPTATFEKVKNDLLSRPLPKPEKPFTAAEVFDDFCVYQTTIKMPTYQAGVPPYDKEGGGWAFDKAGKPLVQAEEEANFVVTLPRAPMPKDGFPVVVFSRTGAGGERPLVDRGVRATNAGEAIEPGSGPAREFAKVGFGGSSIDGPHGGLRNVSGKDEQFLVFNIFNPVALRDNVRQSAVEIVLQSHILEGVAVDASACPGLTTPGGGPARFDVKIMAAFGHSMGASIVPLALAFEPRLGAAILSGAGSSYIDNVIYKKKPIETKGFAELLLKYAGNRELTELDPVMSLLQWAAEPADTQAYARLILREPADGAVHHVMMVEGVVDHYIMPPIANATVLSMGLDLAGPELDQDPKELVSFDALSTVIDLGKHEVIGFPAKGNVKHAGGGASTAVVVQQAEDGVEDGHEASFQTEPPKHQYRCFLQSFAKGTPSIPMGDVADAPCE
jgi:hypothetical protein